jgi:hypothetical protein
MTDIDPTGTIVVGADGAALSAQALRWAADQAVLVFRGEHTGR